MDHARGLPDGARRGREGDLPARSAAGDPRAPLRESRPQRERPGVRGAALFAHVVGNHRPGRAGAEDQKEGLRCLGSGPKRRCRSRRRPRQPHGELLAGLGRRDDRPAGGRQRRHARLHRHARRGGRAVPPADRRRRLADPADERARRSAAGLARGRRGGVRRVRASGFAVDGQAEAPEQGWLPGRREGGWRRRRLGKDRW
mmetsp:Transcript_60466/g.184738  ORF Transcript_60466/g.184738 Transcript_60466/m.184738 type:complete len:201 (-) Transcript_60466:140-742(-)